MIRRVADRQAKVTGENPDDLCTRAVKGGIEAVRKQKSHMIRDAVERLVRRKIFGDLPTREYIETNDRVAIQVDVSAVRTAEEQQFERFLAEENLEMLLQRYPLRESGALSCIARNIGLDKTKYEAAVRTLLHHSAADQSEGSAAGRNGSW